MRNLKYCLSRISLVLYFLQALGLDCAAKRRSSCRNVGWDLQAANVGFGFAMESLLAFEYRGGRRRDKTQGSTFSDKYKLVDVILI